MQLFAYCRRRPFLMPENHFRSHFSPFQINVQLFLNFFSKIVGRGHYCGPILAKIDRDLPPWYVIGYIQYEIDGSFRIKILQTQAFSSYFHKMAAIGNFFIFRFSPKSIRLLNGSFKYEFDMVIRVTVTRNTSKSWSCGGDGGCGRDGAGPKT